MVSPSRWVAQQLRIIAFKTLFRADKIESFGLSSFIIGTVKNLLRRTVYSNKTVEPFIRKESVSELKAEQPKDSQDIVKGVLFIGYAEGSLGLGQSFRSNLEAARKAEIPFAIFPVRKNIETRLIGPFMEDRYDLVNEYKIKIFEIAVDQIEHVKAEFNLCNMDKSYNILRPYWELSRAPSEWRTLISDFHELWAPNQYIADAFSHIFDKTIIIMPPAIDNIVPFSVDKATLGLEEGVFWFLFSFDYNSSPYRKNPLAVIEAFSNAFVGNENVGLVIKSNGDAKDFPHIQFAIEDAAEKDSRIRLIDVHIDRQKMRDLLSAADVYVSLHRAEGLGLGMVEAMALERSVIGTNFSGSTDFLNSETGYPIPYRLRPIQDFEYPWSSGQLWAEPDIKAATSSMFFLYQNRLSLAPKRGLARQAVIEKYGHTNVGNKMKGRLEQIQKNLS